MNDKAESFFDDTIKTLSIESESAKFANVTPETLTEFYSVSGIPSPAPQQIQTPPAYSPPQPAQRNNSNYEQQKTQPVATTPNTQQQTIVPTAPVPQGMSADDIVAISKMDLAKVERSLKTCNRCPLYLERKNPIIGAGNPTADLMFISEGPSIAEDEQGIPLIGEDGQLLTGMINAMQFSRSDVYITHIIKCRTPKNRKPEKPEVEACMEFLKQQIKLINPKVIITLGAVPLQYLLNQRSITQSRGQWMMYQGIKVMPIFHPSYLNRNPMAKKETWSDLQLVMKYFGKSHRQIAKRT